MVKNNISTLLFQVFSFIFSICGILSIVYKGDEFSPYQFLYYTILSNGLIAFMFGLLIYQNVKEMVTKVKCNFVKSGFLFVCVIDILVTMLIYWVILRPESVSNDPTYETWTFSNLSTHLITPLLAIINFVVFDKLKKVKYKDIYMSLVFPYIYFFIIICVGMSGFVYPDNGTNYPYFFMDFNEYGAKVFLYIIAITIVFLILSHIAYFIIKKTNKNNRIEEIIKLEENNDSVIRT